MVEGKGKGGKGGKGRHRRPPRNQPARPESPETWRQAPRTKSPPSAGGEGETHTRIVNADLSLPWMQDNIKPESKKILDDLMQIDPSISTTAWVPMVDLGQNEPAVNQGSFLGGNRCLMKKAEALPVCLTCKSQLNFVCQIDRASLLHPFQGVGLIQVFACPKCAHSNIAKPRNCCWATLVDPTDKSVEYEVRQVPAPRPNGRRVVKWLPRKDYMHPSEAEILFKRSLSVDEWRVLGEAQIRGDKIGGCVPWLNCSDNERSRLKCKLCDKQQRLVIAIDTFDNLAYEWGHDGSLLVFDCASHPEQVTALVVST